MAKTAYQIKKALGLSNGLKAKSKPETTEELKSNIKAGKYKSSFNLVKAELENTIRFDTFQNDLSSVGKTIEDSYKGWQSSDALSGNRSSIEAMKERVGAYKEYQRLFGTKDAANEIDKIHSSLGKSLDGWDDLSKTYGKYKNADAYKKAEKDAKKRAEEYEGMKTADIGVVKKEITSLEEMYKIAKGYNDKVNSTTNSIYDGMGADEYSSIVNKKKKATKERDDYLKSIGYDSIDALEKALGEKKQYKNKAEWIQKGLTLSSVNDENSKNYDKDFEKYSGYVAPKDKFFQFGSAVTDEDIHKIINDEEYRKQYLGNANSSAEAGLGAVGYEYMTNEEKELYNYYYNKYGVEKGKEYLNTILEDLGTRKALADFERYEGKTWSELGFGVSAGLDQFASGMKNLLNTSDEYIPVNSTQQLSGLIREDLTYEHGNWGKVPYDLITTTSNMLPSILTSKVIGTINPVVGANVGATLMGASAAGNAYQEMLNLGYDKGQARTYSTLVGVSEAALERVLGGISSLGGTSGKIAKLVDGIDNGLARFAIRWGGSMVSEGVEESLQEILDPIFQNIAAGYDTGAEVDWSEVVYSGLLGALSGGVLEGVSLAPNSIAESRYNKAMGKNIKANERVGDVFDLANNPEIASAYETYTRYAKKGITAENISDAKLGRMYSMAKMDYVEILNSKKSTSEQKENALKRLAELSIVETENVVAKEKKNLNIGEETTVTESGETVDVKDLKVKGEDVVIATDKGEISVEDMTFKDKDADLVALARVIAREEGEDIANLFINQYDGEKDVDAYANSFNLAMAYAKNNFTINEMLNKKGNLSAEQVKAIYQETVIKADKEKAEYIKKLNKEMADKGFYKGFIDDRVIDYNNTSAEGKVNWKDLTARQRQAITFIKGFAQATGMNLEFVANNPKYNGKYDRERNTLTINLDKGGFDAINNIHETIIPTMSHETTHWMKEKSPELWRNLNEIVFSTLTEHYNSNTEQAIKDKIALLDRLEPHIKHTEEDAKERTITEEDLIRAEMNRKGKSEDVSREEIVARACEDMLKMSEQGRKIFFSLSEAEQKTLAGKIKSLINDLLNWVNELLNSYEAASTEARIMREYKEQLQKASKVWDEMLKKSVVANQSLENSGAYKHKKSTSEGDVVDQAKELDSDGNSYWQIETEKDIFAGIESVNELQKAAYDFILNGDKGNKIFGTIDGAKIEFIRVSAREYVYGEASKTLTTEEYKQKMRMSTSIIDLIENASIEYDSPDHKNHKLFPNGFKNYQGRVGIDETIFRYIVRVGKSKDGMIFYDINLEVDGKVPRANRTSLIKSSTSNDSVLNSDKIVKEKNSDRDDVRLELSELNKEYTQLEREISNIKKSNEYLKFVEDISTLRPGEEYDRVLKEYGKWVHDVGFYSKTKRLSEIEKERKNLKSIIDNENVISRETFMKSIDKLTENEKMEFVNEAVKAYGTTNNVKLASYLMLNGEMLDFSEGQGYRVKDHREISEILDMPESAEYSDSLIAFMNMGNIRMQTYGIDISQAPNQEQKSALRDIINQVMRENEEFSVDFSKSNGHTDGSVTYPKGTSSSKILADIDSYFETGVVPEYESSISQFLYSDKNPDIETQINTSMTMDEAKQMIQRAFVIGGIYEWYDREYKNGDEWLRGVGASEVALNIENEYTLTEKYLNKLQGYIDGDFYVEDILEAYLKGTLVGKEKPKAKRLDISKEYRINDERFYSPQRIKDAKKLLSVATQRMTEKNRKEVSDARAKVLIFAHNKGASELLGMTQAELNKKLRAWSNYSAKARDISKRFNNGVADSNKWTGIENCSWLYRGTVTTKDLESLVKSVKGASGDYEKFYIARTMLALDTHIDWSWLSFEFDTYNEVNKGKTFSVSKCLGYYTNEGRKIVVTHDKPHTVAHEMGHALDYQWARDLGFNYEALTEVSRHTERITDAETKQFFENFRIFIDSLTDNGDIRSEYTQNPKEVFARFVARFVQWVENTGTGRNSYNIETSYYNDKFTASHYIEFVKLLQEKAMLDAKKMETNSLEEVRFSEKEQGLYDIVGETERIRKENEKFKAEVERLNERLKIERQVTHGNYFNENQLGAVAGHLRNISNSNIDKVELMRNLKDVYSFIAHSENLTWEEVFEKCYNVADAMIAEAKPITIVDDYSKHLLREIRNTRISLDETQKQEAQHHFGKNWNRSFMGKVIITNDGINIDAKWQEWSRMYPEIFSADTNSSDMIRDLYDIIGSLREASVTIDAYGTEEQKRWLANEIYNQYWNISPIRTTADKYDKQIKRLNFEHRRAMTELRDDYNTRLKEQHKADREKQKKLVKEIRERKDKEIALAKKHGREMMGKYKENAERKTRIQSITSNSLNLNEMLLKNSKDKHIPEIMKEPVTALLQAIDFSSKRMLEKGEPTQKDISLSKALGKVKDMMVKATNAHDELVELYGHGLDEDIEIMVDHVDDIMRMVGDNEFVLNRMSLADLQTLDKMVKTIRHAVNKLNKFHTVNHARGIANLSQESVVYLDSLGKANVHDGFVGKAEKMLNWGNALPYYAFKRYGSGGMKVYEALQDGWDKFAFNTKAILDYANESYTSEEVNEWGKDIKTFKILIPATEFELADENYMPQYQEVQLTVPQIMSMYCLNKREQARGHLFKGGIRVADFKTEKGKVVSQTDGIIFTEADVSNILNSLTDRQKAVADKLQRFMNTVSTDWGNEVSMARFGYKAFGEENYFPIQSDKNNLAVNDETEQINSLFKLLNMSFTKNTVEKANNRIVISDIFDVFAQHTSDMAKYNALALPVLDAFKWYNYTEKTEKGEGTFRTSGVKQSIEKAFGKDGQSYFTTFLKDINGQQDVSRDTLGKSFFTNAKIAAVGMNLRVVLLQPTSYARAGAVIDNKYLVKALSHKPKVNKAEEHCGIALWKSMGYYDTNIQRGVEEQIKHADTWKDKATEWSMKGAEVADKLTWGYLWNACELEIRDTRKDLKVGSKEFYEAIGKRLREVIYATQVVDSTMTRSQMMRSTDWRDKMITSFASEPTLSYNMLQDAYMEYSLDARQMGKAKAIKKNASRIARVISAYTITNAVAALVESAFDAYREDDDEEMDMIAFMKLYLKNFAFDMSIGNKIPYVKELYSLMQGYSSSRLDTQWVQYLYSAINAKKPSNRIKNSIRLISQLSGIPFYNVYRDTMAALNKLDLFTEEDLNEMFGDFDD